MKRKYSIEGGDVPSDACNVNKLQLCNDIRESAVSGESINEIEDT